MSFYKSQKRELYHERLQEPQNMFRQEPQNMLYHEFHDLEGTKYVISLVSAMVTKCVIQ